MAEEDETTGDHDAAETTGTGEYGENRSDVDAMGNAKRREVIGKQYGASVRKRLLVYGGVLAFMAVVVIVFLTVVTNYDNRDMPIENTAPWSQADASSSSPPRDVDFKANGPRDCDVPCDSDITIPAEDILNR